MTISFPHPRRRRQNRHRESTIKTNNTSNAMIDSSDRCYLSNFHQTGLKLTLMGLLGVSWSCYSWRDFPW